MATKKLDEPMIGFLSPSLEVKARRTADGAGISSLKIKKHNLSSSKAKKEPTPRGLMDLIEGDTKEAKPKLELKALQPNPEVLATLLKELEALVSPVADEVEYSIKELTNRDTLAKRGFTAYAMLRSLDLTDEMAIEVAKVLCDIYLGTSTPPWEKVKALASDIYSQYLVTANVIEYLGKDTDPREVLVTTVKGQCMKHESAVLSAYVETLWAMQSWLRPDTHEVEMAIRAMRRVTDEAPPHAHMRIKAEGKWSNGMRIEMPTHRHLEPMVNEYFEKRAKTHGENDAAMMAPQIAKLLMGELPSRKDVSRAAAEVAERTSSDLEAKPTLSRDAQFLANEMGAEALGKRIRRWRLRNNLSATDLAKLIGVSVQAVSSWENGYTPPSFASIKLMAICFGIPAQTLELGIQDDAPSAKPQATNNGFDERYVEVNLYDVQFSAGSGNLAPEYHLDEGAEPLAFRRSFFQNKGIDPKYARCFRVDGDSMQPYLTDGDIVLVDCREVSRIKDGKVYAIRYADELRVKRLKRSFEGDYVLLSDNADYEPVTIPRDAENFAIIGEVRWRAG